MLDSRRLRMLVTLAERQTIAAVADELDYTPSTVSQALSSLEAELGIALLERGPRSVRLTAAGSALAGQGRSVLDGLIAAEADARAIHHDGGALSIAAFPSAAATLVAPMIARMSREDRPVLPSLVDAEPDWALAALRRGEVDVAIVYEYGLGAPALDGDDLCLREIGRDPICICAPAGADADDLRALAGTAFVAGRKGTPCHEFTRAACRQAGFEPHIAYETDDVAVTCALVDAGLGAAIMARALLATGPRPVASLHPSALPHRRVVAASRPASGRVPSIADVIARIEAEAERSPLFETPTPPVPCRDAARPSRAA